VENVALALTGNDSLEANHVKIEETCKPRRIGKIDIDTPLLVPSFSSVAFEKIREIHEKLRDYLFNASLVGAYDLFYNKIDQKRIWVSDTVFVDSGTFEKRNLPSKKKWSSSKCANVFDALAADTPVSKVVIVNYDQIETLKRQVLNAKKLFSKHPDFATCFLCKPTKPKNSIEVVDLVRKITLVEPFNILGFAEKELGNSFLQRCKNLLRIRSALNEKKLEIPIHIFGCLDPLGIISYFICGADIFDGLSWLKYGFDDNVAVYINNSAILKGDWSQSDSSVNISAFAQNLKQLTHLMHCMRRFAQEYKWDYLELGEKSLRQVKALTGTAGVQ